ncbi:MULTISPECIES: hypothetical protein [Paraburkholderia]|uniref:hypothetical protein n=1 Tax=Paraburkholderia TaxID=1822464 RepID=UPI001CB48459|nr:MULTISPECIES: hypothetical protein [Paraburkholderia]GJH02884.1 hypothetical protein CBA19C8_20025 [Paraburkholderia terrae]GJH35677.1 hypothetical protein CBA19CS91_22990 [Paraburkholderia hospita]CAG9268056.1 conserved hypothetical protein [Paraburkholderia caribensis]
MTLRSASPDTLDALPNPRGGAVRPAEQAIADALDAFEQRRDMTAQLLIAGRALRDAGWLAAHRFTDALLLVSPMAASGLAEEAAARATFGAALRAFRAALERRNLRELGCSASLFAHYRALSTHIAQHTPGYSITFEDIALAGRPVPPVSLRSQSAARLAHLRARYEQALLPVLRSKGHVSTSAVAGAVNAALDDLDACLVDLSGPDPYDFWRLALACSRALRASGHSVEDVDTRRFYARCNMALADEERGIPLAPRSLVRATLALLWRDYALFGAAAEDTEHVELLRDYGLTVDWHIAGTQASEALWEAGAHQAETLAAHVAMTRELGVLTVNANAYEDFLQTADAAISALTDYARAADNPQKADPSAALQAGDAAYRLGAAASALGLGQVALLADALGLAWRRRAHAGVSTPAVRAHIVVEAPDARSLEAAAEALRAMLHKVAAGVAPQSATNVLGALTRAIEQGGGA